MGRTFYTERDIEDLAKRGIKEIEVNESVYITDIAREKMETLGIKTKAVPSKPVSASASTNQTSAPALALAESAGTLGEAERKQVIDKVKSGVIARLGSSVDAALLDTIVRRVVGQL